MGNSFPHEPKIPRLFLDSSVIIAGLASRTGASHAILALAELGLVRLVGCPYILTEVERNLAEKVPEFLPAYRRLMVNLNWQMVEDPVAEDVSPWLDLVPAKDAPVLAAAVDSARIVSLRWIPGISSVPPKWPNGLASPSARPEISCKRSERS